MKTLLFLLLLTSCHIQQGIHRSELMYSDIHYLQVDSVEIRSVKYYLSYPLWPDKYFELEYWGADTLYIPGGALRLSPVEKGNLKWKNIKN